MIPTFEFSIRVLFINVKGHGIQYGALGKSSLKSNIGLAGVIQQALKNLLKGCKDKFPTELMDIKEFSYRSSVERYSPIISKNLASMVVRSDSIVFKSGLFEILSRCDPESSASLSVLLGKFLCSRPCAYGLCTFSSCSLFAEGSEEEKLRDQLNVIFCKWFLSRAEQGPSAKTQGENNELDSDDYIFEKEEGG